jgi:alkanesulfonate monooxygenase SsuD/methylene tetrahydromethanopterin reductase-like flavin-dependent oxidoreductase (luciferase family)
VDFDPIGIWPKPVQKPYPPIYVGGGRRAIERIAIFGDAWLANGLPPDRLEPMLGELREVAGRDVPVSVSNISRKPPMGALHERNVGGAGEHREC